MARTVLQVTADTKVYAKTHGAKYDRKTREWYIEGEVPPELENLLAAKEANPPFEEVVPSCPLCQTTMVKRANKTNGNMFWGCSRFRADGRGCKGKIDYQEYLDAQLGHNKSRVTEFLKGGALPVPPPAPARVAIPEDDPRLARWKVITELAARECGGVQQAGRWMQTPKIALGRRTPLEAMITEEGCQAVERLLRELNT